MKNSKGFTFIEILVVITIIGLLTTIAVISYSAFLKQSRNAKRKADLEQIRSALEMYRSNEDTYPVGNLSVLSGTLTTTYIQTLPTDPKNPSYVYYYSSAAGTDYTVGAYFESTSTCSEVISCGGANCNYCVGPYGQK